MCLFFNPFSLWSKFQIWFPDTRTLKHCSSSLDAGNDFFKGSTGTWHLALGTHVINASIQWEPEKQWNSFRYLFSFKFEISPRRCDFQLKCALNPLFIRFDSSLNSLDSGLRINLSPNLWIRWRQLVSCDRQHASSEARLKELSHIKIKPTLVGFIRELVSILRLIKIKYRNPPIITMKKPANTILNRLHNLNYSGKLVAT